MSIERIQRLITDHGKKVSFTLEAGRGQTYASGKPTLYAHHPYPRHSVLRGRYARVYVEAWDSVEEAKQALAEVAAAVRGFRYTASDYSSFIPVDVITAHLPDTPDLY